MVILNTIQIESASSGTGGGLSIAGFLTAETNWFQGPLKIDYTLQGITCHPSPDKLLEQVSSHLKLNLSEKARNAFLLKLERSLLDFRYTPKHIAQIPIVLDI
jgi:hypothetical protein